MNEEEKKQQEEKRSIFTIYDGVHMDDKIASDWEIARGEEQLEKYEKREKSDY